MSSLKREIEREKERTRERRHWNDMEKKKIERFTIGSEKRVFKSLSEMPVLITKDRNHKIPSSL
jgi:hypothetical protein